ncbi:hypothetical protein LXL04_011399 [Taraxacum kok-saghyz]
MEENNISDQARSLSSKDDPNPTVKQDYSAQDVADAFVKQYYNILQESPQDTHRFYKDQSILARPCPHNSMKSATTLKNIDEEIMASNIKNWNPNLTTVHAQDSVMGSVIVGVTGFFSDNDNVTKHFSQTFCLAPQEGGGFYVHNDILQFVEINNVLETSPPVVDDIVATATTIPKIDPPAIDKAKGSTKKDKSKVASTSASASSSKGKNPLPNEANKKIEPVKIQEDAKRVSYASIVAKEGPVVSTTPIVAKEGPVASTPQSNVSITVPKQSVVPVRPLSLPSDDVLESMYDVNSIRIKDLPAKMTEESLLEAVKKRFGPVRNKNIQIKEYSEDGYRYAFVEFDSSKSARTAVEGRFIRFEDRECEIQYKRHNQGGYSYTGRLGAGRGGFRNENSWGGRYSEQEYNNRRNNNRNFQDRPRSFT